MMQRFGAVSAGGGGGGGDDPYWASVVSLLNFPGTDGSTAIVDAKGKTWTAYGDAQIDTSLGYNTCQFDGAGDYIETPHSADFVFGTGDFTIEGIDIINAFGADPQALWEKRSTGFTTGDLIVYSMPDGGFNIYAYDYSIGALFSNSGLATAGVPFHWAWTRSGTTMRFWFNGALISSVTTSASLVSASTPVTIGKDNAGGGRFWVNGRCRARRVTKGVCRYTAAFTPPAAPFPVA